MGYGPTRPGTVPTWVKPPKKAQEIAKRALKDRAKLPKSKRGGLDPAEAKKQGITSGVTRAKSIARGDFQPAEDIVAFFNRFDSTHTGSLHKSWGDSKVQQAWDLWGATAMREAAEKALRKENPRGDLDGLVLEDDEVMVTWALDKEPEIRVSNPDDATPKRMTKRTKLQLGMEVIAARDLERVEDRHGNLVTIPKGSRGTYVVWKSYTGWKQLDKTGFEFTLRGRWREPETVLYTAIFPQTMKYFLRVPGTPAKGTRKEDFIGVVGPDGRVIKESPPVENPTVNTVERRLQKALQSAEAYAILDKHPQISGSSWSAGGCWVLAEALHSILPGSELYAVTDGGQTEHVVVKWQQGYLDVDGWSSRDRVLRRWAQEEGLRAPKLIPFDTAKATGLVCPIEAVRDVQRLLKPVVANPSTNRVTNPTSPTDLIRRLKF